MWQGRQTRTSGGLTKADLVLNKRGQVVSKARSRQGKRQGQAYLKLWNDHVRTTRQMCGRSLRDVLKVASKSYAGMRCYSGST